MKNKKLHIVLSCIAIVLVVTLSISIVAIINQTNNKITKKQVIKHTKIEYADEDLVDFLDEVIDDFDFSNTDDAVEEEEIEEDENIDDDMDWIYEEGEKTEETDLYTSVIKKYGSTPANKDIRNINIDTSKTVYKNFYGLGGNLFGEIMCDGSVSSGYNSVAWEYERQKLVNSKIRFVRMPINIDVIVTDTEADPQKINYIENSDYINYMEMCYDFNSDSALSFWKHLDALSDAGSTLFFNPGWKCDQRIKMWYPENPASWSGSAPYDLNAFVRACLCWILEAQERGYGDIFEFIGFGNEVTYGGDFSTSTRIADFMIKLNTLMTKAIEYAQENTIKYYSFENGIRVERTVKLNKNIKLLAVDTVPENNNNISVQKEIVGTLNNSLKNNAPFASSIHKYYKDDTEGSVGWRGSYDTAYTVFNELRETIGPQIVTEFFACAAKIDEDYLGGQEARMKAGQWDKSYASYFIVAANTGMGGLANWAYATGYYPSKAQLNSWNNANGEGALFSAQNGYDTYRVTANYRLVALLQHTVPQYSNVLYSDWEGDDIRTTAFKLENGDYTFVVEAKKSDSAKTIKLNFDKALGKKLYKYSFIDAENLGHNDLTATLLQPDKVIEGGSTVTETILADYGVYVFTTKAPEKQVILDKGVIQIAANETATLEASFVNCGNDAEVEWCLSAASKDKGTTLQEKNLLGSGANEVNTSENLSINGTKCVFDPKGKLKSGDCVSVNATLKGSKEIYTVAVIYIS